MTLRHPLMRLPLPAILVAAATLVLPAPAAAQFELAWDKCPGSAGASLNKRFACNDDYAPPMRLVLSFTPPKGLPRFVGYEATLEISSANGSLPDWWKAGSGECREGAVTSSLMTGNLVGTCENPWAGGQNGGGSMWTSGWRGPGRSIFQFAYARTTSVALSPGTRYFGGVITIDPAHASGTDGQTCAGCASEVCIAITEIVLAQEQRGAIPESDDEIEITYSTTPSVVTFNARDPGSNPCGSKVRNSTWGRIKTTYR